MNSLTLRTQLLGELTNRKSRNAAYSLRAFARDLGIGATTLSDYLSQKRKLSKSNIQKISETLGFSPVLKEQFFIENKTGKMRVNSELDEQILMEDDTFKLISDWYYLALLNIAQLKNNKADPDWLAERLDLEVSIVEKALTRLFRLKLLKKNGLKLVRTARPFTTSNDIPSAAIKKYHAQNLALAEKALFNEPLERRDFGATTMTVNKKNLIKVKKILMATRNKIADMLSDDQATDVYTISIQLFPLTKNIKEENPGEIL